MPYPRTCALFRVVFFFSLLALAASTAHAQQQAAGQTLPYMNPALPVDQRVKDLIGTHDLGREGFANAGSLAGHSAPRGTQV